MILEASKAKKISYIGIISLEECLDTLNVKKPRDAKREKCAALNLKLLIPPQIFI